MKEDKIYRSLEYIRDEYLEDAADAMRRGRVANRFRKPRVWIIAAACLFVLIAMISVPIVNIIINNNNTSPYYIPFGVQEIKLSPSDLSKLFNSSFLDIEGTKRYSKVKIDDPDSFELTNKDYLPIYEYNPSGRSLDRTEFDDFALARLERLCYAIGANFSMEEFEFREYDDRILYDSDHLSLFARQEAFQNLVRYRTDAGLYVDGKQFVLNMDKSDEEIASSVGDLSEKLFEIMDVSFQDIKIKNQGENGIIIIFYDRNVHPLNDLETFPYSDYIMVFYTNRLNITIDYVQKRVPINQLCGVVGKAKRISLEKAEEYLSQGYVFGGYHSCPFCRQEEESAQPLIDFTDYEYVDLEYVTNIFQSEKEKKYIIPFYAFYKYIGDNNDGEALYAKTYVPAIEVEGIVEYFSHQS